MSQGPAALGPDAEVRVKNRARFELELEFVQALANPFYLHSLAQQGVLNQPAFVNYLEYLQYWKEKDYARFILYPHALHHLELLQHEKFREEISKDGWRDFLSQKQYDHWRTWRQPQHLAGQDPADATKEQDLGLAADGADTHGDN
ncbi:SOH1-domain-containing protein [Auriscalpium vulgare]|uniref:SOH1-domain-containing protein n=1 Tax=Auriscalpium vulgare TaxID=40419 RepID=A0ACB8RCR3_9AGAM|nr:SOH1-domain-containing protein [Auriscalpium vulgare]